jgi:hypothetical protein
MYNYLQLYIFETLMTFVGIYFSNFLGACYAWTSVCCLASTEDPRAPGTSLQRDFQRVARTFTLW